MGGISFSGAQSISLNGREVDTVKLNGRVVWQRTSGISYRYPVYNTAEDPKSGISCWNTGTIEDYTLVQSSAGRVVWNDGWHVVDGTVTLSKGASCNGAVKLLITDGSKLIIDKVDIGNAGIEVRKSNLFSIYGQIDNTGIINIVGGTEGAGIGGREYEQGQNITINGGIVIVTGGTGGAGIGGAHGGAGSDITINGGTVTANGGKYAAGIGGSESGTGSDITINGGIVMVTGGASSSVGSGSAGIGGGRNGIGKNITINGGTVTATGGVGARSKNGDGIGGGYNKSGLNIKALTSLVIKAGDNNPPTTIIDNDGNDLAAKLTGKQYVTVTKN